MLLIPIHTPLLKSKDDLASILMNAAQIEPGDIIVISSKAVATVEGGAIDLSKMHPSEDAKKWSMKTGRSPAFTEATLMEMKRLHGNIIGDCPGALLTEVQPEGLPAGTILTANAGLDESNVEKDRAMGWPREPLESARRLREELMKEMRTQRTQKTHRTQKILSSASSSSSLSSSSSIAIIISDSCCHPRRLGVTAFALVAVGMDPIINLIGREDLFGKKMRITTEAVADQLATAANMLMGNEAQSLPAVIVRDHGLPLSDFEGWVPGIETNDDLFQKIL